MPLGVGLEQAPGAVQRALEPQASERVVERLAVQRVVADAVRGEHWQPTSAREFNARAVRAFLFAEQVALQLDIHVAATEDAAHGILVAQVVEQRDQAGRMFLDIGPPGAAGSLCRAQVRAGEQAAEVAIARAGFHQHRQPPVEDRVGHVLADARLVERDLAPDQGPHTRRPGRLEEAGRAGHRIPVAQRQRLVTEVRGLAEQVLRIRGTFQKAEAGRAVKFDVHAPAPLPDEPPAASRTPPRGTIPPWRARNPRGTSALALRHPTPGTASHPASTTRPRHAKARRTP